MTMLYVRKVGTGLGMGQTVPCAWCGDCLPVLNICEVVTLDVPGAPTRRQKWCTYCLPEEAATGGAIVTACVV